MAVKQAQKFTEEELTTLKTIQSKSQEATFKCGQLYLSKLRLEAQEKFLQNQIQELEQQEATIAKPLQMFFSHLLDIFYMLCLPNNNLRKRSRLKELLQLSEKLLL